VTTGDVDPRIEGAWALRRSDPVTAVEQAEVLRDEALERGDDATRCRALTVAGAGHVALSDYPSALRALLEAAALIDAVGDRDRARAQAELGYLETILGDTAVGLERLMEALEIHERLGDDVGRAATLNRIGVAFFSHGDLDEAQHAYEQSLELIGDDEVVRAGTCNNLAKVLTERGEYETALEHLRAARDGFEAAGEGRGLGMTFHNAAVVNERLGNLERMEDQLETAIDLYDRAGHVHGACESRTHLARHLIARGTQPQRALALLERAHDDAERVGLPHECAKAAEGLVDAHEQLDQADQGLSWLRHVRDVERRLFDRASEQRLRSLQVRYQLERLERDSITDALTELLNRRGLDRVLRDSVAHAHASGTDLAVLLLDLDDFKQINDRFSHTVGDEVLRELGVLLRERTRPTDLCARFGGEEFVVALPACDLDKARKVADSLRHRIADHDWSRIASGLEVTASIGVAVLSSVADLASLLDAADRALYDAKEAGKDRVALGEGSRPAEETTARVGR
jgi:diguanylate cyclase (GGDEF)-like protein